MNKFKRRVLYLTFLNLFLITVPVVIFFVQGYRFDRNSGVFVYSGSVAIKSWPRDIEVFLDGEKYSGKKGGLINETFIINGLRPGKYALRCQKEGYTPWEKNIEVHSGISTEFWNVLLFPKPEKLNRINYASSQESHRFFISPREKNELVFFKEEDGEKQVHLLNLKTSQSEKIFGATDWNFPDPQDKENVEWSTDNRSLLIPMRSPQGEKEYFIGKIKRDQFEQPLRLSELFSSSNNSLVASKEKDFSGFQKTRWMFEKNDELVVLTLDQKLYYLNIKKPEEKLLLAEDVSDFNFAGNRIYYAQSPHNLVWEIRDNDIATKRQITKTSFPSEKENDFIDLKVYDEYRLAMINQAGDLFVFNQEKEKNEIINEEMQGDFVGTQFTNDGKKLLFWSEHEIWVLFLREWEVQPVRKKNEKSLIVRFSQPLSNVQWMESYENVLFSSGNWIKSAEIDLRSRVNIVDVLEKRDPWKENEAIYDKDSQNLFFLDQNIEGKNSVNSTLLFDKKNFLGF